MKIFNFYLWLYLLSIIIFGAIYHQFWKNNSDSFIINSELNLNPLSKDFVFNDSDLEINLAEFASKTSPIRKKLKNLNKRYENSIKYQEEVNLRQDSILELNSKIRNQNIEIFEEEKFSKIIYINQKEETIREINNLKNTSPINSFDSINNIVKISNLVLDTLKLTAKIASEKKKIYQFELSNFSYFDDQEYRDIIAHLDKEDYYLMLEQSQIYSEEREVNSEYELLKNEFINARKKRLNFFEFLYFSSANASTVTYGEIVPNNNTIRSVIMIQVLVCLVLFGGYLSKIYDKK